jgi:hypothetical protein
MRKPRDYPYSAYDPKVVQFESDPRNQLTAGDRGRGASCRCALVSRLPPPIV